jgi:Holliday junction resolvase RusA-like endonuclease
VSYVIVGLPCPKGSKTAIMRGDRAHVIDAGSNSGRAKLAAWKRDLANGLDGGERAPDGPLWVGLYFRLPMPKSRPAAIRKAGRGPSTVKPDIDKLTRTVLDALTLAEVISDDAVVCELYATKMETTGQTGVEIQIRKATL